MKHKTELQRYTIEARKRGLLLRSGSNGGGWCHLAISFGFVGVPGKAEARRFVRDAVGAPVFTPSPVKTAPVRAPTLRFEQTNEFLQSFQWRQARMVVLKKYGSACMCCGATPKTGAVIHVDHIKPRKLFPELALDQDNLQVLCHECNHGKGNWDQTDWRPDEVEPDVVAMLRDIAKHG